MKLHAESPKDLNIVTGYDTNMIEINRVQHSGALLFAVKGPIQSWAATQFDQIDTAALAPVLELRPELVLIGTGSRQRFVSPAVLRSLLQARIGVECMDTQAAARTYNILAGEGRHVAAALLPLES